MEVKFESYSQKFIITMIIEYIYIMLNSFKKLFLNVLSNKLYTKTSKEQSKLVCQRYRIKHLHNYKNKFCWQYKLFHLFD
jgi:hypothetical protein